MFVRAANPSPCFCQVRLLGLELPEEGSEARDLLLELVEVMHGENTVAMKTVSVARRELQMNCICRALLGHAYHTGARSSGLGCAGTAPYALQSARLLSTCLDLTWLIVM
jgi:hypothetical protein